MSETEQNPHVVSVSLMPADIMQSLNTCAVCGKISLDEHLLVISNTAVLAASHPPPYKRICKTTSSVYKSSCEAVRDVLRWIWSCPVLSMPIDSTRPKPKGLIQVKTIILILTSFSTHFSYIHVVL